VVRVIEVTKVQQLGLLIVLTALVVYVLLRVA
jgi:hypothetical protein